MADESKALVPLEQKVVEFYGDELTAVRVEVEGKSTVYVPVRPICDYMGVDWSAQFRRINRDPVLSAEVYLANTKGIFRTFREKQPKIR